MSGVAESGILLTSEDLARWEEEERALRQGAIDKRRSADEDDAKADQIAKRIETANLLRRMINGEIVDLPREAPSVVASPPPQPVKTSPRRSSWKEWVRNAINESGVGMSGLDLRKKASEDPEWGARLEESDKGFYHALARLQHEKVIEKFDGRYYSPAALMAYKEAVERGDIEHAPALSGRPAPLRDAVLDMISAKPGITAREIINHLRADPEFSESISANSTGAYNALARVERRNQIQRLEDGTYHPGPRMPARDPDSRWLRIVATSQSDQGVFGLN